MATTSSPPSPLYDPARRDMFVHVAHQQSYYLPDSYHPADARQSSSSYFYPAADASSANSLHQGTHDANAVRLSQSQVSAHPSSYQGCNLNRPRVGVRISPVLRRRLAWRHSVCC